MIQKFLFDSLEADIRRREVWLRLHRTRGRTRGPTPLIVDPYQGCAIACAYCFARGRVRTDGTLFDVPSASVEGGLARLRRFLASPAGVGGAIVIGSLTDPYQAMEKQAGLTRRLLRELCSRSGLSITIATKSPLVVRDRDLLFDLSRRNLLRVEISLMSLDDSLLRLLEPEAPPPGERLAALRKLVGAGVPAGVVVAPIIAGLNDSLAPLESVIRAAAAARASFVDWIAMTLPDAIRRPLLGRLRELGGQLADRLGRLYPEGEEAPVFSTRLIATRIRELKLKYEIEDHPLPRRSRESPAAARAVAS